MTTGHCGPPRFAFWAICGVAMLVSCISRFLPVLILRNLTALYCTGIWTGAATRVSFAVVKG